MSEEVAEAPVTEPVAQDAAPAPEKSTMFDPSAVADADAAEPTPATENAPKPEGSEDRPEWLMEKYKSVEDQAKAYKDLYSRFSKKTDDLKAEVLQEAIEKYGESIGVPADIDGYEYPESVKAPEGELDTALRTWAKENNVKPEAFQQLAEMYASTVADPKAEFAKLGSEEEANRLLENVNKFANKFFSSDDHGTLERIMQTADGVKFIERLMVRETNSGVFKDEGMTPQEMSTLTRENIRNMQADPRFGTDDSYTEKVREMWRRYSQLPADKQR